MAVLQEEKKAEEKLAKDAGKHQQQREASTGGEEKDGEPMEVEKTEIAGSKVMTLGAERPPESTIHTQLEHLHLGASVSVGPRVQGHQITFAIGLRLLDTASDTDCCFMSSMLVTECSATASFSTGTWQSSDHFIHSWPLVSLSIRGHSCRNTSENNTI